ncbi:unnamed protein product [Durusdinium trenchii]|uniref:Uncharacterized protein n=1 Tax=Durusdinium trenchii TaxID=1381693 RepID=A0ABP0QEL1_9DINO
MWLGGGAGCPAGTRNATLRCESLAAEAPEDEAEKDGAEEEPPQEDAPLEEVMDEPDEAPGLSQIHCEVEEDHVDSTLQLMLDLSEDQEPGGPCRGAKGHVFEPDPSIEVDAVESPQDPAKPAEPTEPELPKPDAIEVFENPPESPADGLSGPGAFVPDSLLDEVEFVGVCEAAPLAPSAPPAAVVAEAVGCAWIILDGPDRRQKRRNRLQQTPPERRRWRPPQVGAIGVSGPGTIHPWTMDFIDRQEIYPFDPPKADEFRPWNSTPHCACGTAAPRSHGHSAERHIVRRIVRRIVRFTVVVAVERDSSMAPRKVDYAVLASSVRALIYKDASGLAELARQRGLEEKDLDRLRICSDALRHEADH